MSRLLRHRACIAWIVAVALLGGVLAHVRAAPAELPLAGDICGTADADPVRKAPVADGGRGHCPFCRLDWHPWMPPPRPLPAPVFDGCIRVRLPAAAVAALPVAYRAGSPRGPPRFS